MYRSINKYCDIIFMHYSFYGIQNCTYKTVCIILEIKIFKCKRVDNLENLFTILNYFEKTNILVQRLCSLDYDVNNIAVRTFMRARKWIHYKYYSERADLTGPHNEITRGKSSRLV